MFNFQGTRPSNTEASTSGDSDIMSICLTQANDQPTTGQPFHNKSFEEVKDLCFQQIKEALASHSCLTNLANTMQRNRTFNRRIHPKLNVHYQFQPHVPGKNGKEVLAKIKIFLNEQEDELVQNLIRLLESEIATEEEKINFFKAELNKAILTTGDPNLMAQTTNELLQLKQSCSNLRSQEDTGTHTPSPL